MKAERNSPCPCGSGKKFKRCHYLIDHEAARQAEIARRAQWKLEAETLAPEEPRRRPNKTALAALLGMVAAVK